MSLRKRRKRLNLSSTSSALLATALTVLAVLLASGLSVLVLYLVIVKGITGEQWLTPLKSVDCLKQKL